MAIAAATAEAPFKPLPMLPPKVKTQKRKDGSWLIDSAYPLGPMARSIAHLFEQRAGELPNRKFICQRKLMPDFKLGDWRSITYGVAITKASQVAQAMLDRGMGPDTPVMVLSGNSIEHAVIMLGAMKARVPVAPVSVAYSLFSSDHGKLKHVFNTCRPKMIFADFGPQFAKALAALPLDGIDVVTVLPAPGLPSIA